MKTVGPRSDPGSKPGTNPKDLVGAKKAPLRFVPPALEIIAAPAMDVGQMKYGPFNWRRNKVLYTIYLEAIKRHVHALLDGEDYARDKQTGILVHHMSNIAANTGIIADAMYGGNLVDDRPPKGPAPAMLEEQDRSMEGAVARGRKPRKGRRGP